MKVDRPMARTLVSKTRNLGSSPSRPATCCFANNPVDGFDASRATTARGTRLGNASGSSFMKVAHYGAIVITVSTSALQAESRGSIPRDSTSALVWGGI